ncbi:MAG: hypothetical protein ACP6IS_07650 [Candidatus Asgardarchaeia archaeon]
MPKSIQLKTFAWDGLELKVPESWNLSNIDLTTDLVTITLSDDRIKRLVLVMAWGKKFKDNLTPMKILEDYARYMSAEITGFKIVDKEIVLILKHKGYKFYWENTYHGFGVLWSCPISKKVIILATIFRKSEITFMKRFEKVFRNTIKCHSLTNLKRWAFLNFDFQVPKSFEFVRGKFTVGKTQTEFEDQEKNKFYIIKFSFGKNQLRKYQNNPERWFREFFIESAKLKGLKLEEYNFSTAELSIHGHKAYSLDGTKKERVLVLKTKIKRIFGYIWYCDKSNNLYVVMVDTIDETFEKTKTLVSEIARNVYCHVEK